ncbi:MAG: amidohydrolase family protein [Candidatus Pacebacteria bacterium]|nr:amidohydrolase family protein [Candidatus Paceibacterota bacterium]MDD5721815.1 amidohydrolase family protein [Candidatus Paceibacterota bacterium]
MVFDILIKNGQVFDGSGISGLNIDIGVNQGKIAKLGNLKNHTGKIEINAENRFVCPGFIDINNNADHYLDVFFQPGAENMIRQGVTTIVCGNSGASLAPLITGSLDFLKRWADANRLNINWHQVKDLLSFLDIKKLGVNFATLIGWGSLRNQFTKGEFRNLTKEELEKLKLLVSQSLNEGALGVSFGLGYASESMVGIKEILEIAKIVKENNKYLSFHLRNEADGFLASVREIIEIAEKSKSSIQISHFKAEGEPNFSDFDQALKMIKKFNDSLKKSSDNQEMINFDVFPYSINAQSLYLILPDWAAVGGREVLLKNIRDEIVKAKLIEDIKRKKYLYKKLRIADCGQSWWFVGKTLEEIAKSFNLSLEESIFKIIELSEDKVIVFTEDLSEDNVIKAIKSPYSFIGTNSGFSNDEGGRKGSWIHPRAFGSFPKFLEDYTKEQKLMSWEEAIHKITGKVAQKTGLKTKGLIKKDYDADIVVFNPEKIKDTSTSKNPFQYPEGIETVIINGGLAYYKGVLSEEKYGQTIKN